MPISFERDAQCLGHCRFSSINEQPAAHINDVDDHKEKGAVVAFMRDALHGREQLLAALLDGLGAGRFDGADSKSGIAYRKLFKVGGNQRFGGFLGKIAGGGGEDLAPKLLDIFSGDLCQFGGDAFVARCAGWGAQHEGIVEQAGEQQARDLARNSDASLVIESDDNGTGAANGIGAEYDRLAGMYVGNAVMVDDAKHIRLVDAVDSL